MLIDLFDSIICSSCLLPRAVNPSLVSKEAVLVPVFLGFEINAAVYNTATGPLCMSFSCMQDKHALHHSVQEKPKLRGSQIRYLVSVRCAKGPPTEGRHHDQSYLEIQFDIFCW